MKQSKLYIYTRGPLHIGCGSDIGALDNPVVRERITNQPIIPGSSLKGSLRAAFQGSEFEDAIFGPELVDAEGHDNGISAKPGGVIFGDGRLLTLPVRSAKGCFALITSPLCMQRHMRLFGESITLPSIQSGTCMAGQAVINNRQVILEEYPFSVVGEFPTAIKDALASLISDPIWVESKERLTIISDEDFSFFCTAAMEITYHNRLENGVAAEGALFNLECVPSESLFVAPITFRNASDSTAAEFKEFIKANPILQIGGKSTTGRGFCSLTLVD